MTNFFKTSSQRRSAGFTLIELLVVIAIIGILASVVLASLGTARRKSRDARRVADIKQIQLALELYFDAAVGGSANYPASIYTSGTLEPTYIPKVPTDPLGGNYNYACSGTTYHLAAALEESTNPALNADRDANGGICTGDTINGQADTAASPSNALCVATAGGGRYCYDVTP